MEFKHLSLLNSRFDPHHQQPPSSPPARPACCVPFMTPKLPSLLPPLAPTWNLFVGVVKIQKVMITPLSLFLPRLSGCEKSGVSCAELDEGDAQSSLMHVNSTYVAKKSKDGLRDIARVARRDRDARNTRLPRRTPQHKCHMCTRVMLAFE